MTFYNSVSMLAFVFGFVAIARIYSLQKRVEALEREMSSRANI